MKRKLFIISFLAIAIIGIILFITATAIERGFSDKPLVSCKNPSGMRLDIAIIGDSWVERGKIDIGLNNILREQFEVDIESFGEGGAKSKQIFENLFCDPNEKFSSNRVLTEDFEIVVVIAGVNDLCNYIGSDFYAFHIERIVKQLNQCGKFPVVVTLPEFGIEQYFEEQPIHKTLMKYIPHRILFDKNTINPRQKYINEMKNLLKISGEDYLLIEFDGFINDYEKQIGLYTNPSHLTVEGYVILGEFIGKQLLLDDALLK